MTTEPDTGRTEEERLAGPQGKSSLLGRLGGFFTSRPGGELIAPPSTPVPLSKTVRVAWDGKPFTLSLGNVALEFHPDLPVTGDRNGGNREWIVHAGDAFYEGVPTFIRIRPSDITILGRIDEKQEKLFGFNASVASRHVRVLNSKGELTIQLLEPDRSTTISEVGSTATVWEVRRENLTRLPGVLGHDLTQFDDREALGVIRDINAILGAEAFREADDEGAPGGIIRCPEDMTVVIMGDVHARVDNVLRVVTEGGLLAALEHGEACLIFLGDLIHSEEPSELEDLDSSVFILDLFCMLKRRFPENIFYIHGNHESFSPDIGKNGVPQGLLMRNLLKKRRGKDYVAEVEKLFDGLAFIVHGNEFAACHGGPNRSKVTHETLVNIRRYPGLQSEIVWNRLRQGNRVAGYGKGSVKRLRRTLNLSDNATVVVGHSPLSEADTLWLNVGGIEGHHILFSAHTDRLATMVMSGGNAIPLEFVPEPALAFLTDPQGTHQKPRGRFPGVRPR